MALLIKVMAIAVTGSVLVLVIKKNSPEMALLLTISLAAFALFLVTGVISGILDFVRRLAVSANVSPAVIAVVLKTVGIAIITRLSADVCRDAGQSSIASGVDIAGAVAAIYISLPLLETAISMISSLV